MLTSLVSLSISPFSLRSFMLSKVQLLLLFQLFTSVVLAVLTLPVLAFFYMAVSTFNLVFQSDLE